MKQTTQSATGTSFYNCTVKATVTELKAILGEPCFSDNDGSDKVNFEWEMETSGGYIFTVYDWKEYRTISEDEVITWHIGGKSANVTIQAQAEIITALSPKKTPQERQFEQTTDKLRSLVIAMEETLQLMPIKSNKSEDCQRTYILNYLGSIDSCISGIELEDFTPNEYSGNFELSYS